MPSSCLALDLHKLVESLVKGANQFVDGGRRMLEANKWHVIHLLIFLDFSGLFRRLFGAKSTLVRVN